MKKSGENALRFDHLCFFKHKFVVLHPSLHLIAQLQPSRDQLFAQGVLHPALDGPAQRPCAKLCVKSRLRQQRGHIGFILQGDTQFLQALLHLVQHQSRDLLDLRLLQGVEHRASCRGYDTIVCITHRDPAVELRYLDLLKTRQVDGAIGFTAAMPEESLSKLSKEYPYVLCCARPRCRNISCVCIDHQAAAKDATEHFIRTGHTRIAFINCCSGRTYEAEREQGYKEALAENDIPFCQEYLQHTDYNVTDGYEACKILMALEEPPTAIFCNSDQLAAGACKYLLKSGKMPGKDVDVIGFDGTFLADMCTPALSTILQPGYDMGKTAFDLLYDQITDPKSVVKRISMQHTLIHKETTHPLPEEHIQP